MIHLGCPSALSLARVLASRCRKSLKELEDVKKVFAADEERTNNSKISVSSDRGAVVGEDSLTNNVIYVYD